MICRHKLYHFTVANTRFTAPLTRRGKTKFATIKWYNLCLQIIQSQTCYPLIRKTTSKFRDKRETNRSFFYNKTSIFAIFSTTSTRWYYFENANIFSFPNSTSWQNKEKLTWILPYSAAVWLKNWSDFRQFFKHSCPLYRIFIYK